MHTLAFARHCVTEWNKQYIIAGQNDIPLTTQGREQAIVLGSELRKSRDTCIKHIVTSDLLRAQDSAMLVAHAIGLKKTSVHTDPRFREVNFGSLQGRTVFDVISQYGQRILRPPFNFIEFGGESYEQVLSRILAGVRYARQFSDDGSEHASVLIIGHGWSTEALFWHLSGEKVQLANAAYRLLGISDSI